MLCGYATPGTASAIHFDPGGSTQTSPWCTTFELPGRISAALTQTSSGKFAFTSMYWYSIVPVACTVNSAGISTIMSGVRFHPSVNAAGAGVSFASPSAAPVSAHEARMSRSACVSRAPLENL